MFDPFHRALAAHLDARQTAQRPTIIVAIHSFTPVFHGVARPWHAGVLYDRSKSYGEALVAALARADGLIVAANQPYGIDRSEDYTIPIHGDDRGIPAVLIEIRQDLLATDAGAVAWASRLVDSLTVTALQVGMP
jgi:predicted N-formylglutamate amidohydrolase